VYVFVYVGVCICKIVSFFFKVQDVGFGIGNIT